MTEISNRSIHLRPFEKIGEFDVRSGFYEINGATAIPGGVNFTIHSNQATSCELLLFHRTEEEPFAVIKIPEHYRIGNVYSIIVFRLQIEEFEYAYRLDGPYEPEKGIIFDKTKYLLDPYAKAVTGQSVWGRPAPEGSCYKGRVVKDDFDWGDFRNPNIPMSDLIIYELHVRGFTKADNTVKSVPGTYAALLEKIPYLKKLGVNAIELMPIFEFDEIRHQREHEGQELLDYWGYNPVCFFAPNTSYCAGVEYNREGNELKKLIKTLNESGIEVILDVVFNHTAEGNENGPYFSFKGFDNNIYYMLTPDGYYFNYSGCGNTLNCNHPIVQQMIVECLRYWVTTYRVNGFRFDLATILGRNEDGSPMSKPPLLEMLAFDPILGKTKLIAEAWDAGGLYQVGSFPSWNRFAEWNGKYRDDIRSFLKGDAYTAQTATIRITGSPDLYDPYGKMHNEPVNFLTCHDGFTLYDLYSFNQKHNEANGWDNTDGSNDNQSWNCGAEGETDDVEVIKLRKRMIKNACAVLMMSRGTPMFLSGDEFCNTQFGNNNPYCQDNIISWLDWSRLDSYSDMFDFFRFMIAFRKEHVVIRKNTAICSMHFIPISVHGSEPWKSDFSWNNPLLGVMYAGRKSDNRRDDLVYLAINTFWEKQTLCLPEISVDFQWKVVVDTWQESSILKKPVGVSNDRIELQPRSVQILAAERLR
jgi:glycogen operon protein